MPIRPNLVNRYFIYGISFVPLGAGAGFVYYNRLFKLGLKHRDLTFVDYEHLMAVGPEGQHVPAEKNPGVRLQPNFVKPSEEEELLRDCRILLTQFGSDYIAPHMKPLYEKQLNHLDSETEVKTWRVTGRPGDEDAPVAKWNYGHHFDREEVPKSLLRLVERIESSPKYSVGGIRDLVIEQRRKSYFRVDPHIHPSKDASELFLVTLLSDTVLTLTEQSGGEKLQEVIATQSFLPTDMDIWHPRRSLVHLTGAARDKLAWAIRQGVDGADGLADWWGSTRDPKPRNEERISILMAFARY